MTGDFTRQFFVRANEYRDLPCPTVLLEEDGDICFDWDLDSRATISVSVSANGHVGWAALIGDYKSHGGFDLPAWNDELDRALSRLQMVQQAKP